MDTLTIHDSKGGTTVYCEPPHGFEAVTQSYAEYLEARKQERIMVRQAHALMARQVASRPARKVSQSFRNRYA